MATAFFQLGNHADATKNAILRCNEDGFLDLGLLKGISFPSALFDPGGRLTLSLGNPIMAGSVAGATTVYYSPYAAALVPLYNGSLFVVRPFTELSQMTTDGTKSPGACVANSNYDLFVWDDNGVLRLSRGPAWSSATARGTGTLTTELVRVAGTWLNAVNISNGPMAQRGTYVGSVRTNAASTVDYIFGSSAAGGGAAVLNVWNCYNRIQVATTVNDTTPTWTISSNVGRPLNVGVASGLNNRISFLSGLQEEGVPFTFFVSSNVAANGTGYSGFAMDRIAEPFDLQIYLSQVTGGAIAPSLCGHRTYAPQIGFHYVQALERGDNVYTTSFSGGAGVHMLEGLSATLRM